MRRARGRRYRRANPQHYRTVYAMALEVSRAEYLEHLAKNKGAGE